MRFSRLAAAAAIVLILLVTAISAAAAIGQALSGDIIAYVTRTPEGGQEIFAVDLRTRQTLNLTRSPADERDPAWSPDGQHIAFVSNREEVQRIYVMDADGSQVRLLTPATPNSRADYMPYQFPRWSADGERILFMRNSALSAPQPGVRLYSVNWDSSDLKRIDQATPDGQHYVESLQRAYVFSPDGQQRLYLDVEGKSVGLYIGTGDSSRLLYPMGEIEIYTNSTFSWSPDGTRVAFVIMLGGTYHLRVMALDGEPVRTAAVSPHLIESLVWRP